MASVEIAVFERGQIELFLPQRGQALMIDRCTYFPNINNPSEPSLVATYLVPQDSWWVAGHFPGNPIMPGTMILEFAAQACALFALLHNGEIDSEKIAIHARDDKVRYLNPVFPGDELIAGVTLVDRKRDFWKLCVAVRKSTGERVMKAIITGVPKKLVRTRV